MWALLLEWCADVLAATPRRGPRLKTWAALLASVVLGAVFVAEWGLRGLVPMALVSALVLAGGRDVLVARDQVWRAATLPLDDPREVPSWHGDERVTAPSAVALYRLAFALDAARRSNFVEAGDLLRLVHRDLLGPTELSLVEAVRAMISLGLGDPERAAQQAVLALPTGSDEIDASLGRVVLADAWSDEARIRAVDEAWERAGVEGSGCLGRLRRLARLRIDTSGLDAVAPDEARWLCDEARAIGDEELAADLLARSRSSRGYR